MKDPLSVLLISGSTRRFSHTRTLTDAIQRVLSARGVVASHWNLREKSLPIADPQFHKNPETHPDENVRALVALADRCDGFVLASPIYHNSFSGVLKNALDWLTIAHFYFKPVALVSHGGYRSTQAVDQLRIVVRGLLGVAIPTQVCTAEGDYSAEEGDEESIELVSQDIHQRIERLAKELVVFGYAFRSIRRSTGES